MVHEEIKGRSRSTAAGHCHFEQILLAMTLRRSGEVLAITNEQALKRGDAEFEILGIVPYLADPLASSSSHHTC